MEDKILFVDDDANLLEAYQRQLRKRFNVVAAIGGEAGLDAIAERGPFAVVISDMRMPHMDGIQFLSRVRAITPDTVRMMLTGNADLQSTIDAVNQGHIFRFLTKPCSRDTLTCSIEGAIAQHHLIIAERELLSQTLSGSLKLLTDILSLVSPGAFGRSSRVRRLVRKLCTELEIEDSWKVEVAAMVSQVGCIAIPQDVLAKAHSNVDLQPAELNEFLMHPQIGRDLIAHIPRLQDVAQIIAYQEKRYDGSGWPQDDLQGDAIPLGARVLKLALDFDLLASAGGPPQAAFATLCRREKWYDPMVVEALRQSLVAETAQVLTSAPVHKLPDGAILADDVRTTSGTTLAAKGEEVTPSLRMRLNTYARTVGVREPVRYLAAQGHEERSAADSEVESQAPRAAARTVVVL